VAGGVEIVFTALTRGGAYDFPDIPRGRELSQFNTGIWQERRPERVVQQAVAARPDVYTPPGEAFDFHVATAAFRGDGGGARLEVYFGVPVREVLKGGALRADLERGVALFDSAWTPVYRRVSPLPVAVSDSAALDAGTLAIDEAALPVAPGRYVLGVQVGDPASGRQAGYTQDLTIDSFPDDSLRLSDLELAGRVAEDSTAALKGGLRVVPLPSRTYKPGQPVTVYYEVYGLAADPFGQTRYRMDYRIEARGGKISAVRILRALGRLLGIEEKEVVTISYERTGAGRTEHNYLEIDMGKSHEGRYELAVTVTDLSTSASAEKSAVFYIGR
jgi:hypothetical protein